MPTPKNRMGIKGWRLKLVHRSVYDSSMQTIRSFIAIPLSTEIRRNATRLLAKLSQPDDGIKWVPTDTIHLTLKFLGEVDNTEISHVCNAVGDVCGGYEPFELSFSGTGGFPDIDRPKVLFAGVDDPTGSLCRLVDQLETKLADLRFKREPRDYRPHLTLGRTRSGSRRACDEVVQRLKQQAAVQLGTMRVDQIQIFASFLDKEGPTYQVMDTIEL
jgi:2'-5' RNA ligase